MLDTPIDDPCDVVTSETLEGWTHCNDSDGMRTKDHGQQLDRSERDRYQNSWLRFDRG